MVVFGFICFISYGRTKTWLLLLFMLPRYLKSSKVSFGYVSLLSFGKSFHLLALIRCLCLQVATTENNNSSGYSTQHQNSNNDVPLTPMVSFMAKKHILLLHAGGDSKRVPWANPMGKVFLPLPYLAADDPDGPVPLLFDHILAIASCARQAFKNEGCLSCLLHLSENFATS